MSRDNDPAPSLYPTGCAGRITEFSETDDGRFLLTLTGVARFDVAEELPLQRGYRRVVPSWERYRGDLTEERSCGVDRARLTEALRRFFKVHGLSADWDAIKRTPDERLVTSLSMICPFGPSEKQALLEAPNLVERGRVMIALIEMAVLGQAGDEAATSRH